jgi:hypothetical protein
MSDGYLRADDLAPPDVTGQGLSDFQSTHPWTHRNPLPFCELQNG